ncbi:unnamed protein product [Bursaphelenchus xylophilus]|uniref:(pine wood nematode) hypothetical protein n=1 Tax=Bursaphelenchus xylophilus TaxID=6326 RepID=A0A1I7RSY3_BURXY|nr:unnamed protein product [Bursaphelenchus xylophilus]CAG9122737.1 unnamed protein product [Bursaphelenchus xylophilus]
MDSDGPFWRTLFQRRITTRRLIQVVVVIGVIVLLYFALRPNTNGNGPNEKDLFMGPKFRFMSFNLWFNGHMVKDGLQKIAKHIKKVDPDVVALQEIQTVYELDELLDLLGPDWNGAFRGGSRYVDDAIISRHPLNFTESFSLNAGLGIEILPSNTSKVRVVSLHLDWHSMGNYATNNRLVTSIDQILAGESTPPVFNRVDQVKQLLSHPTFKRWNVESTDIPVFIAGDFNSASHLDWAENRKEEHGGWVVEWPTTKMIMDSGFLDSFRVVHPDPIAEPGDTWSLVEKHNWEWNLTIPEPQDRIDFIFFKSPDLRVEDSYLYSGDEKANVRPNQFENDYPSDHYAMVSDFNFRA